MVLQVSPLSLDWLDLYGLASPVIPVLATKHYESLGMHAAAAHRDRTGQDFATRYRASWVTSWDANDSSDGKPQPQKLVFGGGALRECGLHAGGRLAGVREALATLFGADMTDWRVRRLDLCADFAGLPIEGVTWATKRVRVGRCAESLKALFERLRQADELPDGEFRGADQEIETLYFGGRKSDIHLCVYDKERQAEAKSPAYADELRTFWRTNGWDGAERVWRVEYRVKGRALDEYRLRAFAGLEGALSGLWAALAGADGERGWACQVRATGDKTRARWPVSAPWRAVQAAAAAFMLQRREPPWRPNLDALAAQMAGLALALDVADTAEIDAPFGDFFSRSAKRLFDSLQSREADRARKTREKLARLSR